MLEFFCAHPYWTIWGSLILMFERAMYCGYVVDDDTNFRGVKELKEKIKDRKNWNLKFFIYFICNIFYGGGLFRNAKQEHLFAIVLHGINCSLIYRMSGSLLATIFYLINPINNQTTIWQNGRRYAIVILGVLLSWNFWWTAPFLLPLVFFHVSFVPMPLLFLWTPYWPFVPVLCAGAGVFGARKIISRIKGRRSQYNAGNIQHTFHWKKIILYIKSIGYNFVNCVLPLNPAMYHDFLYYFSSTEAGNKDGYALNFAFWKGVVVCGLLGYLIIFQHSFWAFWYVLFISPWCNIYQVTMNASDRYCSLANIGVMCLLAEYVNKIPDETIKMAVVCILGSLYVLKYWPLFRAYRNFVSYLTYHINMKPWLIEPSYYLSKFYLENNDPFQAYAIIRKTMRYRPYDFKMLLRFIECLIAFGKTESALKAMDLAEKYLPYGEEELTLKLFAGLREQMLKVQRLTHNKGMPYVNKAKQMAKMAKKDKKWKKKHGT